MIELRSFEKEDLKELTPIMKDAFDFDSQIHLGRPGGPSGYDDGTFLEKYALNKDATSYTICVDKKIKGLAILWLGKNYHHFLGCLFIDPSCENQGIGTHVWNMIEKMYPQTSVWETETPAFSTRNHHFYINKCGFSCYHIDNPRDKEEASYRLRKLMK